MGTTARAGILIGFLLLGLANLLIMREKNPQSWADSPADISHIPAHLCCCDRPRLGPFVAGANFCTVLADFFDDSLTLIC
jgi:hypothetical protein